MSEMENPVDIKMKHFYLKFNRILFNYHQHLLESNQWIAHFIINGDISIATWIS